MKDDRLYLSHIGECIRRIESYVRDGKVQFLTDTKTHDAVLRNLQILAESNQRLSMELKNAHPEVEWRNLAAFRNVVVHGYLGISLEQIWYIVEQDIPDLHEKLNMMLAGMDNQDAKGG